MVYHGHRMVWLVLCFIIGVASRASVMGNPCTGLRPTTRSVMKKDIYQNSGRFLRRLYIDLIGSVNTAEEGLLRVRNYLGNDNHIQHLREMAAIPELTWENFKDDTVINILKKIYIALDTIVTFTHQVREHVNRDVKHQSARVLILQLLNEMEQGKAHRKGLYPILCGIFNQLQSPELAQIKADMTPFAFQINRPSSQAMVTDDSYRIMLNIVRVIEGIENELQTTLRSNKLILLF